MNFTQDSIDGLHRRVPFRAHGFTRGRGLSRRNTERRRCDREHRPSLLVPKRYFKEEGEVECHDMKLHGAPFILLVDNGSAKRRRNRSLRTFWRHEHDATVVTAEKVVVAGQKAKALTVSSGMLRVKRGGNGTSTLQNVYLTPTSDTFQNAYLEECKWVGDGPKR